MAFSACPDGKLYPLADETGDFIYAERVAALVPLVPYSGERRWRVVLVLKDGVVERMVINRKDRPAGPDAQGKPQVYGFFNGGIPPYLGLGMIPSALQKELGPAPKTEQITTPNDNNTVERDTYPGMVLEYDRYTNGNIILGGVILTKADVNPTPAVHEAPPGASAHPPATPKKK